MAEFSCYPWPSVMQGKRNAWLKSGWRWTAVSFIGGNKGTVQRVLEEKGCHPTPEAQVALARLPYRFLDWLAAKKARRKAA